MSTSSIFRRTLLNATSRPTTITRSPTFLSNSRARYTHPAVLRTLSTTAARMGGSVHNLGSKAEFDEALKQDGLMVLDCFATWCGPCKMIAPKIVEFSEQYANARFYKIDVDEVPEVAQELSVRAMPTFMLFKGGEKVTEVVGANPKAIESAIQSSL